MAVFGVPAAHEDDALRAVRAAVAMRERLAELNAELERAYGATIDVRIGINTGEVVAGDGASDSTLVTGDAVNVAARLEQLAAPGEILIGGVTYELVRADAIVEPCPPLELPGRVEPVAAHRLVSVGEAGASGACAAVRSSGARRSSASSPGSTGRCARSGRRGR